MTANARANGNEQVSEQETMFDLQYSGPSQTVVTGVALKSEGIARAINNDSVAEWKVKFENHARLLVMHGQRFTSEDIVQYVGLPTGSVGTNANNAVGGMMNSLAKRGVIRKTSERRQSKRPTSHAAELIVWAGPSSIGDT